MCEHCRDGRHQDYGGERFEGAFGCGRAGHGHIRSKMFLQKLLNFFQRIRGVFTDEINLYIRRVTSRQVSRVNNDFYGAILIIIDQIKSGLRVK